MILKWRINFFCIFMNRSYESFMMEQVHLWMEQAARNSDIEIPHSVMRFYFVYIAKTIHENADLVER